MLSLVGKTALIIGTRRIGATVAQRLAQEGVNLSICYRNSKEEAEHLLEALTPLVERVHLVQGDVTVQQDVERMVQEASEKLGSLWFLINLASGFAKTPLQSLNGEEWDHSLAIAKGNYLLAINSALRMEANPGPTRGHVVFFTDWAADQTPYRDYLPYLTAKASIGFMARAFANEFASRGILVNAVAPGPTAKPPDISQDEWQADVIANTPLKRESSAEEIAEMVVTLLRCETITGETIRIDSGRHLIGPG